MHTFNPRHNVFTSVEEKYPWEETAMGRKMSEQCLRPPKTPQEFTGTVQLMVLWTRLPAYMLLNKAKSNKTPWLWQHSSLEVNLESGSVFMSFCILCCGLKHVSFNLKKKNLNFSFIFSQTTSKQGLTENYTRVLKMFCPVFLLHILIVYISRVHTHTSLI